MESFPSFFLLCKCGGHHLFSWRMACIVDVTRQYDVIGHEARWIPIAISPACVKLKQGRNDVIQEAREMQEQVSCVWNGRLALEMYAEILTRGKLSC